MYYSFGRRDYLKIPAGAFAEGDTRTVTQYHPPFVVKRPEDKYPDNFRPAMIKEYSALPNKPFLKHVEIASCYNGDVSINASDIRVRFSDDKGNVHKAQHSLTANEMDSNNVYFRIDVETRCIVIFTTHFSWYLIETKIWDAKEKKLIFEEPSPQLVDLMVDLHGETFSESITDIVCGDVSFNNRPKKTSIKKLYKLPEIIRAASTFECQLFCNKQKWAKRFPDRVCRHIYTVCIYNYIICHYCMYQELINISS